MHSKLNIYIQNLSLNDRFETDGMEYQFLYSNLTVGGVLVVHLIRLPGPLTSEETKDATS